jgi:hypothetical protein
MTAYESRLRLTTDRFAGGALVLGGVLSLVGNLVHPRYPDDPDVVIYRKIADSTWFAVADVVLIVGIALVIAGLVAVTRLFAGDAIGTTARSAVVIGGALALGQLGIELFGVRQQARIFADAGPNDVSGAFWAANALDHVSSALFASFTVLLLGAAPLLISVAMHARADFARWLTLLGGLGGAVCIVVGFMNLLTSDQGDNEIPFLAGSLLVTVWVLATGITLFRARGYAPADA